MTVEARRRPFALRQAADPITPRTFLVGAALASFMGEEGTCYPSRATIGRRCRASTRNVSLELRELGERGFIETTRQAGRVNTYTLTRTAFDTPTRTASDTGGVPHLDKGPVSDAVPPLEKKPGKKPKKKARRKGAQPNGGDVWMWWLQANTHAKRRVVDNGPDKGAAKSLAGKVQDSELTEVELRQCMAAYLADGDKWIAGQGYPLRQLPGRLGAYVNSKPQHHEPNAGVWDR